METRNNITAAILVEYKRLHDEFLELSFDLYAVDGRPKLSVPPLEQSSAFAQGAQRAVEPPRTCDGRERTVLPTSHIPRLVSKGNASQSGAFSFSLRVANPSCNRTQRKEIKWLPKQKLELS